MSKIYYENAAGKIVEFDGQNIRVRESDLRDYEWDYTLISNPSGRGGRVGKFSRSSAEKTLSIQIRGKSREECNAALNALHAVTEADIQSKTPGRLWLDGQYLTCYCAMGSEMSDWHAGYHYLKKDLKILVVYPFWLTEKTQEFLPGRTESSAYGKKYNNRYPYQYGTGYANQILFNDHYAPTPAIITFYGPCASPQIYIANHLYGLDGASADTGERIVIDQLTQIPSQKVYKVGLDGQITNLFDQRVKTSSPFEYIPIGDVRVQYTGEFGFQIKLIQMRSEPKWI